MRASGSAGLCQSSLLPLPFRFRSSFFLSSRVGVAMPLLTAVTAVNDSQPLRIRAILERHFATLAGLRIAVLGLAFKPETDDVREAPALDIIRGLEKRGARVRAYDPHAMQEASKLLPNLVTCSDAYDACRGADALVLITEWNQFRMLDLARVKSLLRQPVIVDLRNIYEPASVRAAGFRYSCVGR